MDVSYFRTSYLPPPQLCPVILQIFLFLFQGLQFHISCKEIRHSHLFTEFSFMKSYFLCLYLIKLFTSCQQILNFVRRFPFPNLVRINQVNELKYPHQSLRIIISSFVIISLCWVQGITKTKEERSEGTVDRPFMICALNDM